MVQRQIDWSLIDRVRAKNPIVLNPGQFSNN